mmetsp:Transcript_49046/g.154000  ORF Transcript_49046/g.154000 Transcript_49046/m.154000 type:complete len:93 (+) Transcript_49046:1867-2145(+)
MSLIAGIFRNASSNFLKSSPPHKSTKQSGNGSNTVTLRKDRFAATAKQINVSNVLRLFEANSFDRLDNELNQNIDGCSFFSCSAGNRLELGA